MKRDPALQTQLLSMMSKATRSLNAARVHQETHDCDFAASRAYYAAFDAMEASLLSLGITCSTHSGTIATFSKEFIRSGILPQSFGVLAARLFRERQIGDYEFDVSVSKTDADQDIQAAVSLVEAIARHLEMPTGPTARP
jgi:uncharacterized protein (UPF0332 family)